PRLIHWRTTARRGELMVREYEDAPGQNLLLVFEPNPHGRFEDAVTLAATIVHTWCRRRGEQLLLAVATSKAVLLQGQTGPDQERRSLEALAVVEAPGANPTGLVQALEARPLPANAALVVVGAGPSRIAGALESRLRRPVTALDAADHRGWDFYQPPQELNGSPGGTNQGATVGSALLPSPLDSEERGRG